MFRFFVFLWALGLAGFFPATSFAERTDQRLPDGSDPQSEGVHSPRIAVIDVQAISRKASAMKAIQKDLEVLREKYQRDIATQQELLRKAEIELAEVKSTLSKEELMKRTKEFTLNAAELQSQVEASKTDLERLYTEATRQFQSEMVRQVGLYADEKKIDLVLRRSQVFMSDRELDITNEILSRMDRVLPKVTMPPMVKNSGKASPDQKKEAE